MLEAFSGCLSITLLHRRIPSKCVQRNHQSRRRTRQLANKKAVVLADSVTHIRDTVKGGGENAFTLIHIRTLNMQDTREVHFACRANSRNAVHIEPFFVEAIRECRKMGKPDVTYTLRNLRWAYRIQVHNACLYVEPSRARRKYPVTLGGTVCVAFQSPHPRFE